MKLKYGTYIVSCHYTSRVASNQLELHAEPAKSVPLFRLKPATCSIRATWFSTDRKLKLVFAIIDIQSLNFFTCIIVKGKIPDLSICRGFEMVLRPHYIKIVFERSWWCSCYRWRTTSSSHGKGNVKNNIGHRRRCPCFHFWVKDFGGRELSWDLELISAVFSGGRRAVH